MIWPSLLARAEKLVREIIPELADVPLYLVPQAGTPFADSRAVAWTSPRLCWLLKKTLGEKWRGPGIAVVFNCDLIEQEHRGETAILGLALHEIAHAICDDFLGQVGLEDMPSERIASLTALVSEHVARMTWDNDNPSSLEFYGHDEKWLRVCCHMAHRANALGPDYRLNALGLSVPPVVVIGNRPELSWAGAYAACLGDEPGQMKDWPFSAILDSPMPPRFAELWAEDCEAFEKAGAFPAVFVPSPEQEKTTMFDLNNFLGQVTARLRSRQKETSKTFGELAVALADAKPPKPEIVEKILIDANETIESLAVAVGRITRRRQLQTTVARGDGSAAEKCKLENARAVAVAKFEQVEKELIETIEPIDFRLCELEKIENQARMARMELENNCENETLADELAALESERRGLAKHRDMLEKQKRERSQEIVATVEKSLAPPPILGGWKREFETPINKAELSRRLEPALADGLHEIDGDLANIGQSLAALDEKEKFVRAKMVAAAV